MWRQLLILVILMILHKSSADVSETSISASDGIYNNMKNSFNSWEAAGYNKANIYSDNQQGSYTDQYGQTSVDSKINDKYQHYQETFNENIHHPHKQSFVDNTYEHDAMDENSHFETLPISHHIEVTKPVPIPSIKHVPIPISKPYHISVPYPVIVPVPQPYPVKVPVYKPIPVAVIKEFQVPIEKLTPYPVIKNIPIPVTKNVPYPVEKEVKVNVPHPYPVKIPIVKTIVHSSKHFGKSHEMADFDHHHMMGESNGLEDFGGHDVHGDSVEHHIYKHGGKKMVKKTRKHKWDSKHDSFITNHKHSSHKPKHGHRSIHKKQRRFIEYEEPKFIHHRSRKIGRDDYQQEYY